MDTNSSVLREYSGTELGLGLSISISSLSSFISNNYYIYISSPIYLLTLWYNLIHQGFRYHQEQRWSAYSNWHKFVFETDRSCSCFSGINLVSVQIIKKLKNGRNFLRCLKVLHFEIADGNDRKMTKKISFIKIL